MTITLRQESDAGATTKGSSLTYAELDNNFIDLIAKLGNVVEDTTPQLGGSLDTNGQSIVTTSNANITLAPNGTGDIVLGTMTLDADQTVGAGQDNFVLTYDNSTGKISLEAAAGGGLGNVVEDTTPQLGGELDSQGNIISNPVLKDYAETVHALGSTDSPSISVSNGNIQTVTITSALALPAFSDAAAGQTVTLVVSGSGTASGTGTYKFAGGNKTLTNDSIVSIHTPDGTNYFASIATDFQA